MTKGFVSWPRFASRNKSEGNVQGKDGSKADAFKLLPGGRGNNVERNGKAVVSIKASCNPPQYLPWVSQRWRGIVPHHTES